VKPTALVQFGGMAKLLYALGGLLIGWGCYVLFTGDFVATLDIAAGLVASGVGVIALGAVVGALNSIGGQLANRPPVSVPLSPQQQAQPSYEPAPTRPAVEPAAPTLVREGVVEGRRYRFFSDGSIEAEGSQGLRRYRSMDEARQDILRSRDQDAQVPEDRPRPLPPSPSPRRGKQSWENHLPAGQPRTEERASDPYAPPSREQGRADPAAEDDEWSEPFRMLLKGDPDPVDPNNGRR
jgi:hypothetical protein